MMGRLWGGERRILETVDLPVAREPVRPMRSIFTYMRDGAWGGDWRLRLLLARGSEESYLFSGSVDMVSLFPRGFHGMGDSIEWWGWVCHVGCACWRSVSFVN